MTYKFEVVLMDAYGDRRTWCFTCETFAQAEQAAIYQMKENDITDEQIVEITRDWEPL